MSIKRDIIVHGLQSLDSEIGSNCINIAYELSKQNRVLYVNYPMDRLTLYRQKNNPLIIKRKEIIAGKKPDLVKINDNMWNLYPRTVLESISKINNRSIFNFINKINNRRYAKQIQKTINRIGFKNYILFNDSDFYRGFYFKELLNPDLCIYYTRDNMRATSFYRNKGAYYEDRLMAKSDLVVSNSVYLNDIALSNNNNSVYIGQGCDTSLFNKELIVGTPNEFNGIKKPIIGYIGALKSSRLDISILKHIALNKPNWSIVLVGPEDDNFKKSELHNLHNVHFFGSKNEKDLPVYLEAFDVALNPQQLNELTIGNYPRKIDEYLAMGKPVVATRTRAMEVFKEHTYLASNKDEFIELISKALEEDSEEKSENRMKFARAHTWENNVKEIYKAINNTK